MGRLEEIRKTYQTAPWSPNEGYFNDATRNTNDNTFLIDEGDLEWLIVELGRKNRALESLRRKHYECEDSWYSCPKSDEGCANDGWPKDKCNCGADATNELIDAALEERP